MLSPRRFSLHVRKTLVCSQITRTAPFYQPMKSQRFWIQAPDAHQIKSFPPKDQLQDKSLLHTPPPTISNPKSTSSNSQTKASGPDTRPTPSHPWQSRQTVSQPQASCAAVLALHSSWVTFQLLISPSERLTCSCTPRAAVCVEQRYSSAPNYPRH